MQRSTVPYWDRDCPTVTEFLQRWAQCAMVWVLLCRATNPWEKMLRATAARSWRHRERAPKKSHLRNKNKCKHLYFRNSSYDEWEHKYQTMRTTCLWWRKEWEKSFLCFPLKKKKNQQLLSCIHCSTEYAHSISLMSYSYTNVKHKLGSTFPCSIHQGCLMAHPLLCS